MSPVFCHQIGQPASVRAFFGGIHLRTERNYSQVAC